MVNCFLFFFFGIMCFGFVDAIFALVNEEEAIHDLS